MSPRAPPPRPHCVTAFRGSARRLGWGGSLEELAALAVLLQEAGDRRTRARERSWGTIRRGPAQGPEFGDRGREDTPEGIGGCGGRRGLHKMYELPARVTNSPAPSFSGLGRRPLTAVARVQIPLGSPPRSPLHLEGASSRCRVGFAGRGRRPCGFAGSAPPVGESAASARADHAGPRRPAAPAPVRDATARATCAGAGSSRKPGRAATRRDSGADLRWAEASV